MFIHVVACTSTSFLYMVNYIPLYVYTTLCLSINLLMDVRVCISQGSLEKQNGEGKGERDFKQLVHTVDTGNIASAGNLALCPECKQKQRGGALRAVPSCLGNQASMAREDRYSLPLRQDAAGESHHTQVLQASEGN